VFILLTVFVVFVNAEKECRALVMSGGGSKGAWEVGVLWGLYYASKEHNDTAKY